MQSDAIVAKLTGCFSPKQAVSNLLDQKYNVFEQVLPVHFQEHHQILCTMRGDMITSDMRNEEWLPEATQIILNCPHGMIFPYSPFWECCHASKTWSLSSSCSWLLAEDGAKEKSALAGKPAQPALFQNMMENVLLCSAFLLSVKV